MAQTFDESQYKQLLVLRTESAHRLANFLGVKGILNRRLDVVAKLLRLADILERSRRTLPPVVIDDQIVGEAIQPGHEGHSAGLEAVDRLPCLKEYHLGKVFRFAGRADSVIDVAVDPVEIELVQISEGRRVPCDRTSNDLVLVFEDLLGIAVRFHPVVQ